MNQYADVRTLQANAEVMLRDALDAFTRLDVEAARAVIKADEAVDDGYDEVLKRSISEMQAQPEEVPRGVNTMWAARALERIGDHAKNISEYVIYLVEGEDIRHSKNAAATDSRG